jgi:hypothetical protein
MDGVELASFFFDQCGPYFSCSLMLASLNDLCLSSAFAFAVV